MGSGPTVVPQYYGVPWGMYPAGSIIQPAGAAGQPGAAANGTNTAQQQRRPMSPSQGDGTQYQVIPAYYDQNGSLVMTRNGSQLRLVSPASVIVNAQQGTWFYVNGDVTSIRRHYPVSYLCIYMYTHPFFSSFPPPTTVVIKKRACI